MKDKYNSDENLACRVCNGPTRQQFDAIGDRSNTLIAVYFCSSCNAHYTAPKAFDYETHDGDIIAYYEAHKYYINFRHNRIFDYIEKKFAFRNNRFLDIGSGAGFSLSTARERGWNAQGIEPSSVLARYSRTQLKEQVIHGYFTPELRQNLHLANPDGYDYLLIDNVLEHISNPTSFVNEALSLLAPNGVALVAIPPVDWLRILLGQNSYIRMHSKSAQLNLFYDPEQHINYFSRKSMLRLINKTLGYKLLPNRFHHSPILNNSIARLLGLETGYFFITRTTEQG